MIIDFFCRDDAKFFLVGIEEVCKGTKVQRYRGAKVFCRDAQQCVSSEEVCKGAKVFLKRHTAVRLIESLHSY